MKCCNRSFSYFIFSLSSKHQFFSFFPSFHPPPFSITFAFYLCLLFPLYPHSFQILYSTIPPRIYILRIAFEAELYFSTFLPVLGMSSWLVYRLEKYNFGKMGNESHTMRIKNKRYTKYWLKEKPGTSWQEDRKVVRFLLVSRLI